MDLIEQLSRRFLDKVEMEPMSGCWLWIASNRHGGYGGFWRNGKARAAHRESWILFNGKIPDGLHVLHRCDVRCCVNPSHLFLGTHTDNVRDMVKKGRHATHGPGLKGSSHPMAKLTDREVYKIRASYIHGKKGGQRRRLASEYGVSESMISKIVNGVFWRHI